MVDLEYLTAIKTLLDADSTLDTLLGVSGASKVVVGADTPNGYSPPLVNIAESANFIIDVDTQFSEVTFGVIIRVANGEYSLPDYTTINSIENRIHTLLMNNTLILTNNKYKGILPDGAMPPLADGDTVTMRQVRYRLVAV